MFICSSWLCLILVVFNFFGNCNEFIIRWKRQTLVVRWFECFNEFILCVIKKLGFVNVNTRSFKKHSLPYDILLHMGWISSFEFGSLVCSQNASTYNKELKNILHTFWNDLLMLQAFISNESFLSVFWNPSV